MGWRASFSGRITRAPRPRVVGAVLRGRGGRASGSMSGRSTRDARRADRALLAPLSRATWRARFNVKIDRTTRRAIAWGTMRVQPEQGGGRMCVRFRTTYTRGAKAMLLRGTLRALGGTGQAGRLRGTAAYRGTMRRELRAAITLRESVRRDGRLPAACRGW
jgi:hypothetical protein